MITMKGAAVSAKLKEQVEKGLETLNMGAEIDDYPGGRESG